MSGFVLHPEAYTDLEEIGEYIAADNLTAADRVGRRNLRNDPISGGLSSPGPQSTRPQGTPSAVSISARLWDRVRAGGKNLVVIAVLHGRRSPRVIAAILHKKTLSRARKGLPTAAWRPAGGLIIPICRPAQTPPSPLA